MGTVFVVIAALMLSGCLTIQGGGGRAQWRIDFQECSRENLAFSLIPDLGITFERHREKCMRARHWLHYGFTWTWTGSASESASQPSQPTPPGPPPPPPPPPAQSFDPPPPAPASAPEFCRGPGDRWDERLGICGVIERAAKPALTPPHLPILEPAWDTGL
jgi:hypothetical protein